MAKVTAASASLAVTVAVAAGAVTPIDVVVLSLGRAVTGLVVGDVVGAVLSVVVGGFGMGAAQR